MSEAHAPAQTLPTRIFGWPAPLAARQPFTSGVEYQWPPLPTPPVLIRTLDVDVPLMAAFSA
jgi:hypothetical protein